MSDTDACLRCGATGLDDGYLDGSANRGSYQQWYQGPLDLGFAGDVKHWRERNRYRVIARRCASCGHLDLSTGDQV